MISFLGLAIALMSDSVQRLEGIGKAHKEPYALHYRPSPKAIFTARLEAAAPKRDTKQDLSLSKTQKPALSAKAEIDPKDRLITILTAPKVIKRERP